MARNCLNTKQKVTVWNWLERHGVTHDNMNDLAKAIEQDVGFELTVPNVKGIMKDLGLSIKPKKSDGNDIYHLARAVEELYAQFSLPLPEAVTNIINRS